MITFGRPDIRDGVAKVVLSYHSIDERDWPEVQELLIELAPAPNGRWRVTWSQIIGAS